jgi:predicted nucleic acid-binding protein
VSATDVTATTRRRKVATYTADAVALLVYLVDALPQEADRVFAEAEAGETVIQTPPTALAEVLFSVSRDKEVRGIELSGTPEDARQALVGAGPVAVASDGDETMTEFAHVVDEFSIHDGLIVASHLAHDTTAVITADNAIRNSNIETRWDGNK